MTALDFKWSHLYHWISELYNHLNIYLSRVTNNKPVTYGESILKWLLLKLKVVQITWDRQ